MVASQHPYSFVPVQAEQKDSLFPKSLTQLRHNECGLQDSFSEKGKVKSTLENHGNQNLGLFFFLFIANLSSSSAYYDKKETPFTKA